MRDYILRATAAGGHVRAFAVDTTDMVKKAAETHNLSAVATAILGRTMTGAAMMAVQQKGEKDTITIQIKGNGPLGGVVVVSDSKCNIRGYVHNPEIEMPLNSSGKLDVSGALGKGYMNVIKDMGLKEPYIGYVPLVSGEIAEDLAYYYAYSEQIPTVVALGVLVGIDGKVESAGGFMLQLLPDAPEPIVFFLENRIPELEPVSKMLSDGKTPEQILEEIFASDLKIQDKTECHYRCNCSLERMERNLVSLGEKELVDMIEEQHEAELHCHFCNKKYFFNEYDLKKLLDDARDK